MVEVHKHITGAHVPLNQPLFDLDGKIIPPYSNPHLLTVLVQTEVSWWDETHPDTKIGTDKSKKVKNEEVQVRFPQDKNGKIVSKNEEGEYSKDNDVRMRVKYHDNIRFSLGVATVERLDGEVEGRRCEMIDYTGKVVISGTEEVKRIKDKIRKMKSLTSNRQPWVVTNKPPDYNPTISGSMTQFISLSRLTKKLQKIWREKRGLGL